jgi:hypothetical protein
MSRLLQGDEGFYYAYITVRRDLPLEDLARLARSGTLSLVVDHYGVVFEEGEPEMIFLEQLERRLRLPEVLDRGFYEASDDDDTVQQLYERMMKTEREVTAPALRAFFADRRPTRITVWAEVRYRLYQEWDWDTMLAYLNGKLPEGAQLTLDEVKGFSSECLQDFDPEKHEPNREDGTGFLMYFLENEEDRCLPYLGLRILVHAVENDLEQLDVWDEPNWRGILWSDDEAPSSTERPRTPKKTAAAKKAKPAAAKKAKPAAAKKAKPAAAKKAKPAAAKKAKPAAAKKAKPEAAKA